MPVDTNLTVEPNEQSGGLMANPLGTVSDIVGLRGQLLQQQVLAQKMQAYQTQGQIIANSPPGDYGAMVKNLQADPSIGWNPEILSSINTARTAMLTGQSQELDQNSKALDLYRSMIPSIIKNPTAKGAADAIDQVIGTVPPQMRSQIMPMLQAATTGLLRNTTGNPKTDGDIIVQNALGQVLGSSVDPAKVFAAAGTVPPRVEIQPTGPGGAVVPTAIGGIPKPGANVPVPTGLTPEQEEFAKKSGAVGGDVAEEILSNAKGLPTALKRTDLMTQALGQFQGGGGADVRSELGKLVQGLKNAGVDVDQKTIDGIANGSLTGSQVFDSLISRAGVQALKADAQGTGRVMRSEVDRYLEMMSKTQDPQTLLTLMNNMKYTMAVGYDQSQKWLQFKHLLAAKDPSVSGLDQSDFHSWYNHNFDESKIELPKGMAGLNATPASAVKGAASAPKVYNPKTGGFD